jgi:hypothetical protein
MTVKVSHYKKYTKHRDKDKEKEKEKNKQTYKYIRKTHNDTHKNTYKNIHRKTTKTNLIVGGFKVPRIKSYKQRKARSYNSGDEIVGQSQGQSHQSSSSGEKQKRSYWYHVKKAFGKFAPPELRKRYRQYKFKNSLNKISKVKLAKTGNDTNNLIPPQNPLSNEEAAALLAEKLRGPQINNENNEGYSEGPEKPEDDGAGSGTGTPSPGPVKPTPGTGIGIGTGTPEPVKPTPSTATGTGTGILTPLPSGPVKPPLGTRIGSIFPEGKYSYGTLQNTKQPYQGSSSAQATASASAKAASSTQGGPSTSSYTSYILQQHFYPGSSSTSSRQSSTSQSGTQTNGKARRGSLAKYLNPVGTNAYNTAAVNKPYVTNNNREFNKFMESNDHGYMELRPQTSYNAARNIRPNNYNSAIKRNSANPVYAVAKAPSNYNPRLQSNKGYMTVGKILPAPEYAVAGNTPKYLKIGNNVDYAVARGNKEKYAVAETYQGVVPLKEEEFNTLEFEAGKEENPGTKPPQLFSAQNLSNAKAKLKTRKVLNIVPKAPSRPQKIIPLNIDPVKNLNKNNQFAEAATIPSIKTITAIPQKSPPPVAKKPSRNQVAAALVAARPKLPLPRIIVTNTNHKNLKEQEMGAVGGLAPFNASRITGVRAKAEAFKQRDSNVSTLERTRKVKGNNGSGREYNPITQTFDTITTTTNITNKVPIS